MPVNSVAVTPTMEVTRRVRMSIFNGLSVRMRNASGNIPRDNANIAHARTAPTPMANAPIRELSSEA